MKPPFPPGTIDRFDSTINHFLSNFSLCSVKFEGLTYISVEHAYQAAKSLDEDVRKLVMSEPTPARAKRRGKAIVLRPNWDNIKFDIMHDLLVQKFASDTTFERKLLDTGDAILIEGNYWHDLCWGQCYCPRHKWEGGNALGNMLMEIRAEIKGWEIRNASKSVGTSLIDNL